MTLKADIKIYIDEVMKEGRISDVSNRDYRLLMRDKNRIFS